MPAPRPVSPSRFGGCLVVLIPRSDAKPRYTPSPRPAGITLWACSWAALRTPAAWARSVVARASAVPVPRASAATVPRMVRPCRAPARQRACAHRLNLEFTIGSSEMPRLNPLNRQQPAATRTLPTQARSGAQNETVRPPHSCTLVGSSDGVNRGDLRRGRCGRVTQVTSLACILSSPIIQTPTSVLSDEAGCVAIMARAHVL